MVSAPKRVVLTTPQKMIEKEDTDSHRLRVAAYARVSTEKDEQEDSFDRQVEHYKKMIESKSEWVYVDIYADPGISGTRAEKRPDFLRMINDCREGKIQKILVKSISRFARNTVDALQYIRELKELGIGVFFESENIDTLSPGGEVLLTILAAMAEQESRTISSNIKWAYQRRFQAGNVLLNTGSMLGYTKEGVDENGHSVYSIKEDEAEIVRRIYREYVAGITITQICSRLEADGIPTKRGNKKWNPSVILSIVSNEKYTGNAYLGKTFKPDVLSKSRIKNDGTRAPLYYVEHTHPAIVSEELFQLAKKETDMRKSSHKDAVGSSRYTSKYPFSGLLVCGDCGSKLRRHVRTVGTGDHVPAWGCALRIKEGRSECNSRHVREDVLIKTYLTAIQKMIGNAEEIIATVQASTEQVLQPIAAEQARTIENAMIETQEKALEFHKMKAAGRLTEELYKREIAKLKEKMTELEDKKEELSNEQSVYDEARIWLKTFEAQLSSDDPEGLMDPVIIKSLVERIVVRETEIEIAFKCGVTIQQEYVR